MEDSLHQSSNTPYDPSWSEEEYRRGRTRDALGIENFGETVLEDLLPGINNQTRRARYYSFWAWVLHEFNEFIKKGPDATHTQQGFYQWLRGPEAMLIFSHLAHGHRTGVWGIQEGRRRWRNGVPETYPLDWKSHASVNGGAYEQYYRGPLDAMHIVLGDPGKRRDRLQRPVGTALAEAYGHAIRNTAYAKANPKPTWVARSVIEHFARAGCLCRLHHFPEEREALIDAFFRFGVDDLNAVKRLASLCYFLDVIKQSRGEPLDEIAMRAVIYFWSYGSDHPYVPEGQLLNQARRWRIFQLRQYYVFAIESLWALFLDRVRGEPMTPTRYLAWLASELDLVAIRERFGIVWPVENPYQLTLNEFQGAVEDALPDTAFAPGPDALGQELNEHHIYRLIARQGSNQDVNLRAGGALLMLSLLYRRCQEWRDGVGWGYARDTHGTDRLSVESYLAHARRAMEEGWPLIRWLSWLHQRYLWLRHRRVALQRMITRAEDPSLFTWDEGRFREAQSDKPMMNDPRFPSALQIMEDLELIRGDMTDGRQTYELLPRGEQVLERLHSYTIPDWEETLNDEDLPGPS